MISTDKIINTNWKYNNNSLFVNLYLLSGERAVSYSSIDGIYIAHYIDMNKVWHDHIGDHNEYFDEQKLREYLISKLIEAGFIYPNEQQQILL